MNEFVDDYSWYLKAMNEPSLSGTDVKAETYRFLWLSTFDAWMSLRLTIAPDGTAELVTKKTGDGGFGPLVIDKRTLISQRETDILLETLKQSNFWDLTPGGPIHGFDGAQWIVEGVKAGRYHIVERWSGGEIEGWAQLLMKKSGEDLLPIY